MTVAEKVSCTAFIKMKKRSETFITFLLIIVLGHVPSWAVEPVTQTIYLDELDLTKTECGWNTTTPKRTVAGNELRVDGKVYERGVGHHSEGRMMIALPGLPGQFTCLVGIDDEVGDQGNAEFLVYGDGKLLWRSGFLTGKDAAKACDVSLEGIKRLLLVLSAGPEGYGNDHADWLDAKFSLRGTPEQAQSIRQSVQTVTLASFVVDDSGNLLDRSDEYACEFLALSRELKKGIEPRRAAQALRPESTFLATDRDPVDIVLRRTHALLRNLQTLDGVSNLSDDLAALDKLADKNNEVAVDDSEYRLHLFREVAALRDAVALKNPLLDFADILFIKRDVTPEPEREGNHMVDQFFGFHATPGGGLYLLENAFTPAQRNVKDILANSTVGSGRVRGKKIDATWGVLAPELSYDGKTIFFAAADTTEPRHSYEWTEGNCYHIFSVGLDGSKLSQLTDGPWDDIDPCLLPSGRVAFISERRGGYGRCHPSQCLFSNLSHFLTQRKDA